MRKRTSGQLAGFKFRQGNQSPSGIGLFDGRRGACLGFSSWGPANSMRITADVRARAG